MPNAFLTASTTINIKPQAVFAYVADLTKHGEWSANSLSIEAVSVNPGIIGSRYRSTAVVRGLTITAEMTVTEYQSPSLFGFDGEDPTGKFSHRFTFTPFKDGTKVVRRIDFNLSPPQWLMFMALYFPVRRPAADKALGLLKQRLEQVL